MCATSLAREYRSSVKYVVCFSGLLRSIWEKEGMNSSLSLEFQCFQKLSIRICTFARYEQRARACLLLLLLLCVV